MENKVSPFTVEQSEFLVGFANALTTTLNDNTNRIIAEVQNTDALAKVNHTLMLREMRIASIVKIYASGRSIDTAFSIIEEIEDRITNLVL